MAGTNKRAASWAAQKRRRIGWRTVIISGCADLKECKAIRRDALHERVLAYREVGRELPVGNALIKQLLAEMDLVSKGI